MTERTSDTTVEAAAMQRDHYRAMSGAERVAMAMAMSRFARSLSVARIRSEHPGWTEDAVGRELLRVTFGTAALPKGFR
jgi:hypothetical protein